MASLKSNIDIIGYSSRLPGANSTDEFWNLLNDGRCAVTSISEDRWPLARFGHPDKSATGKTYTWAAGQLDDVWGFDPAFFGISPREALQMDPQQRLLLQLVWEALENANVPPSELAGSNTGVYVGAASLDYHHRFVIDPNNADMQFMTGNTLSIVSNRISYIFDLRGPSFTVDTACSSSLVALHEAVAALESGQIDTAIVCGVSMLLSPFAFVGFSRASMLSPTGLCQAFDANGDGYVRSEGGVVLVLRSERAKAQKGTKVHARIKASGINADGRTVGLSLPSPYAQADLLREIYNDLDVAPNDLAFVEAHGTGTRVGDPAEADALGKVIGQRRSDVLPIGSVKTNIGHLEPVSGLAGLLKSVLALKHNKLPRSLHFNTPNPDIPFEELNLAVAGEEVTLAASDTPRLAGINSFGFGGTNAHTVISDGDSVAETADVAPEAAPLILSARSEQALKELAGTYRSLLEEGDQDTADQITLSAAHARDLLSDRLVVTGANREEKLAAIDAFLAEEKSSDAVPGSALRPDQKIAFVFSGNGSQWAGMGQDAYQKDPAFQEAFENVDKRFMGVGGWSLLTTLFSEDLENDIERTEIAQPLLFAIQVALVEALKVRGITPSAVAGHSVGEVAAAWCCGALTLDQAVKVVHARSTEQEVVRDLGSMAALLLPAEKAQAAIEKSGLPRLALAAINSPRSVSISGDAEMLDKFGKFARKNKWAMRRLNLAYPFHSALVDPIRQPLIDALADIKPVAPKIPFCSTVNPEEDAPVLDSEYWWLNVRQPVLFADAISRLAEQDSGVFLEIGPKTVLGTYMNDVLRGDGKKAQVLGSLEQPTKKSLPPANPVTHVAANVVAHGGAADLDRFVGESPDVTADLPLYPWQNVDFKPEPSEESIDSMFGLTWPLLGYRVRQDTAEWFNHLDATSRPWLGDHCVEDSVVFPAAGYTEMVLRAALRWTKQDTVELRDLDILRPLVFDGDDIWETQVRISADDQVIEILSRPRLQDSDWSLNARGSFVTVSQGSTEPWLDAGETVVSTLESDELYEITRSFGLRYGEAFQRAERVETHSDRTATVYLKPQVDAVASQKLALCPTLVDAGFHGLFALLRSVKDIPEQTSFLPIRIGSLRLLAAEATPVATRIEVTKASPRSIEATFEYLDADGKVIARLAQARFRAVRLGQETRKNDLAYKQIAKLIADPARPTAIDTVLPDGFITFAGGQQLVAEDEAELGDAALLLEALGRTIAHSAFWQITGKDTFTVDGLAGSGKLAETSLPLAHNILDWLADSDLATETDDAWQLEDPANGPSASALLRTVVLESSGHIAEASLLSRLEADLEGLLTDGLADSAQQFYASGLFDAYQTSSPGALALAAAIRKLALGIIAAWPTDQALRVLVLGAASSDLAAALDRILDPRRATLVVTDKNASLLARAERLWTGSHNATFAEFDSDELAGAAPFDLILSAGTLADLGDDDLKALKGLLVEDGLFLAGEHVPSALADLILGVGADWWQDGVADGFPVSRQRSGDEWQEALERAGFDRGETCALDSDLAEVDLLAVRGTAAKPQEPSDADDEAAAEDKAAHLVILCEADGDCRKLAEAMASDATNGGRTWTIAVPGEQTRQESETLWTVNLDEDREQIAPLLKLADGGIVHLSGAYSDGNDACAVADQRSWSLTRLLNAIGADAHKLWVIAPGGAQDIAGGTAHRPEQAAIWAYVRVAMNEFPDIDLRLIDIAPDLEPGVAAVRLLEELDRDDDEKEVIIDGRSRSGIRIVKGDVLPETTLSDGARPAMQLDILRQGALDQLSWQAVERAEPTGAEVEISVEASGLNFRDVMWALGLLPEEALEDGFAGPTLGMECCGTIVACGPDVTRFKTGDRVITFAPACFASHVKVDQSGCAPMPSTVSSEEAATIPVTFLTAYYALHHLARLSEGETVLIHGGAGGVGLAAIQIAKWRGAKIIATAGSEEKRNFLRLLGADLVLDSRSLAFVDDVMRETRGEGVDVVLNSLFGEAMERSIEVLRPFGRFLELGKRDYYGNTRIGLRPFRQNLTYFGIDADQLLTRQPKLAEQLFTDLVELFENRTLTPLPYRAFAADGVVDAFRLMQQAGHIGKILLRPPEVPESLPARREVTLHGDATYVIAGGFGGFGAELLKRLADHGARNLLVMSRRGGESDEAKAVIADLADRGVNVVAAACDITNEIALRNTLDDARKDLPPIRGVFHTAMVLNDVLIANLDHDGLARVLGPKVRGAQLLDRLTADDPLDHFVLYSSATTLVGNPGQANYVAANGYLEALARKRRAEGRPALTVAWGAISDAGYLARNEDVNDMLARKLGRHALSAKEALDGLFELMALPQDDMELAAVGYARIDWQSAQRDLALLGTPLANLLGLGDGDDGMGGEGAIDLHAMLEGMDKVKAAETVAGLLAAEIGKILRISPDEIDAHKPLSEIGMDSLMALELRMSAERQMGIDIPLMSLANGATLIDLSTRVASRVIGEESDTVSAESQQLASQHITDDRAETGELADLAEKVENKSREMGSFL